MKFKLKNLDKRLIGAVGGGAANAVIDGWVTPLLPESLAAYPDYVKLGIGVLLPAIVPGQTVMSVSDGIMACAAQNIVGGLIGGNGTSSGTGTGTDLPAAQAGVQAARYAVGRNARNVYADAARNVKRRMNGANAAKDMVGAAGRTVC